MQPKLVTFRSERSLTLTGKSGETFRVHPGRFTGYFLIRLFTIPEVLIEDSACTEVTFDFRAANSNTYRYRSVLWRMALWPPEGTRVVLGKLSRTPDLSLRTLLDTRSPVVLKTVNDEEIHVAMKYTDTRYDALVGPDGIHVQLTVYVYKLLETGGSGFECLCYIVPFEQLLWRRAPISYPDDFGCEDAPFVDISQFSHPDRNLPISPVDVVA